MRRRLLLLIPLLAALAVPAGAAAKPGERTIFQAPRELRSDDAALRAQTLDEIQSLGANWLRVVLTWRDVAPSPNAKHVPHFDERDPSAYNWSFYDRMLQEADAHGLHLLLSVSGPVPRWATRHHHGHVSWPVAWRYGRFMQAVARHYGGIVDAFAIWNEPNHPDFLRPQYTWHHHHKRATSPKIYRALFLRGAHGLVAGGAGRTPVLFGETASRGTSKVVGPITFLKTAMCLNRHWHRRRSCHRLPADGYAHHAYTSRGGPFSTPPKKGDVTIHVLHRLNSALAKAGRAGAVRRGLPIWLTEFGIQSYPDTIFGVPETKQAEWRSIAEHMAYKNRRVVAFSQYLMRDDDARQGVPHWQRYSGFQTGLRGADGHRKKAYDAFRLPLVAVRHGGHVTLWGLVRPATGRTRVTIQYRSRHGHRWHSLKHKRTDHRGAWHTVTALRRGRRYRVRWTSPDGHHYHGSLTHVYRRG